MPSSAYKLMNDAEVELFAGRIHAAGEKLVFANGCFDLLHIGHLKLLHCAREHGDHLVVAINTDASVQRMKGKFRPYVWGPDRGVMLAELSCVDAVIQFNEDTPLELIKRLKPNVLVKGDDTPVEHVVGAREVMSWGGDVVLVPMAEGCSTTDLARQIYEKQKQQQEEENG